MKKLPISKLNKSILMLFIFIITSLSVFAQGTVINGIVTDAKTKETLPYVTVTFVGSTQGVSSDNQGKFRLSSRENYSQIKISYIGFKTTVREIEPGKEQSVNVALIADNQLLNEVVVKSGKKTKYRNKNNPAVELIRMVIAHKEKNRVESYDYAEYHQYERMNFYLSNLSDKFKNKRIFKNYQFLFREQDSTEIGGKNLLPIYMEEKLSQNYYRKSPFAKKQVIEANKQVKYDESFIDNKGLAAYFERMYQDIDIYDNNISLVTNQLLSPIADHAPDFYKFFITDTLKDQSPQLIELSFTPRNTTDLLFEGKLYVTMDGNYAIEKAVLKVNKHINLNFVREMRAVLSFEKNDDGKYHLNQSLLKMEFGLSKNKGGGVYGERKVILTNFLKNNPRPEQTYSGPAQVYAMGSENKDDRYWLLSRPDTLAADKEGIYKNIDSLQTIRSVKRTMDWVTLGLAGYKNFGAFETGPASTFYSFNPVEGFRARLGGRSTPELSKRYYFETYGAYGTKDQRFKYFLSSTYSINDKSIYSFPQNYIRTSVQHDTKIPGQELQFVQEDNFLLSFKRGNNEMWLYNDIFRLDYVHEYSSHFSYTLGFKTWDQSPAGSLFFQNALNNHLNNINSLQTTELSLELRYAPHEAFYQGKLYRVPIVDHYPIITLRYNEGIKNLFGGNYNYQNIALNIDKRFYLSQLGYTDVTIQGSNIFGKVPFPLLDIANANQTYSLQLGSYNLMNFQEFVSDHYASIFIDHNFNGFLFNKIPLLKKLKLREMLDFKSLWGGVRSQNNPATDPALLRFPSNNYGVPITYSLNNGPYMEASAGVGNIFKVLRIDLVRRLSYLDHPDVSPWGIRGRVKFDF
jgi:hypothetical protein